MGASKGAARSGQHAKAQLASEAFKMSEANVQTFLCEESRCMSSTTKKLDVF